MKRAESGKFHKTVPVIPFLLLFHRGVVRKLVTIFHVAYGVKRLKVVDD